MGWVKCLYSSPNAYSAFRRIFNWTISFSLIFFFIIQPSYNLFFSTKILIILYRTVVLHSFFSTLRVFPFVTGFHLFFTNVTFLFSLLTGLFVSPSFFTSFYFTSSSFRGHLHSSGFQWFFSTGVYWSFVLFHITLLLRYRFIPNQNSNRYHIESRRLIFPSWIYTKYVSLTRKPIIVIYTDASYHVTTH